MEALWVWSSVRLRICKGVDVSDEVKCIAREVRGARSELKAQPLARLIEKTQDSETVTNAITALLQLCERSFIGRQDLMPHAQTLLGLCSEALDQSKPVQADPCKMEWIIDPDYKPIRHRAGLLLDIIGYLPTEEAGPVLRAAFSLTDPRLKLIAAPSLLRNLEPVDAAELEKIAASHEVRILLWEQLRQLQMELMPIRWSGSDQLAASELSRWIEHPMELGTPPEEIELIETFPVQVDERVLDLYLFRFREFAKPWEPDQGWKAGVAGPYENGQFVRSCFSSFESWDARTPEDRVKKMIAIVSGRDGESN
ncbi:MAG: hypothetical protein JWN45_2756 [Acidobacteriaceae bacterium]|nr:hypothetical protein [Acidobacteriaceae bacterium]